jgi:hypothetical protein
VINLSPDKGSVFREAFRVLKPGGRLAVADVVVTRPLSPELQESLAIHAGCIAGAATPDALHKLLTAAGFEDIRVTPRNESRTFIKDWIPGSGAENHVLSATIEARKPGAAGTCCGPSCCAGGS